MSRRRYVSVTLLVPHDRDTEDHPSDWNCENIHKLTIL